MILGDPAGREANASGSAPITLDDLFRHALKRRPEACALADPPNRAAFTIGPPRRYSYAEADRIISAIADRLCQLGLATDSVIGLQLPNTAEAALTLLGVLRAGMIAAMLPLLWRRADLACAVERVGARAIVTCARIGAVDHCELAMHVAADVFAIRHLCGFGARFADGVIPLDDLLDAAATCEALPAPRAGHAADHVAVITFESTAQGPIAVARSHKQLVAGGLATLLEAGIEQDAALLGTCSLGAFGGLAHTFVPWLIAGGTLSLHHGFDRKAFAAQCGVEGCDTVVVPGVLVAPLHQAALLSHRGLRTVLAAWRAPEQAGRDRGAFAASHQLVDAMIFGEIGLIAARCDGESRSSRIPLGPVQAPRGETGAMTVVETARSEAGTLLLRGPAVPRHPFPPGIERSPWPQLAADAAGFVDTGYRCRIEGEPPALVLTGPPAGTVSVGGYRFLLSDLQEQVARLDPTATIGALPDALAGHRLFGLAADARRLRETLAERGVNPLLADAFRERDAAASAPAHPC